MLVTFVNELFLDSVNRESVIDKQFDYFVNEINNNKTIETTRSKQQKFSFQRKIIL
jgi:hypothetical protein